MHIPENYLSPSTCAVMTAAMVPAWAISIRRIKKEITRERLPLMGVGAAFSFLVMMFNVPLPGGSTCHAVGGVLLAVLLGPWSACISITVALLIQAMLFGDGGLLSLGANCFNLAFVMPFTGYFIYSLFKKLHFRNNGIAGAAVGAYFGINFAALLVALELGIQPLLFRNAAGQPLYFPFDLSQVVFPVLLPHIFIAGFVEAFFTVSVLSFIKRVSPGNFYEGTKKRMGVIYGFLGAVIMATPLGLIAAGTAWGEWGADEISGVKVGGKVLGFVPEGIKNGTVIRSFFTDYKMEGLPEGLGYVLSAAAGAAVLVIIFKVAACLKKGPEAN